MFSYPPYFPGKAPNTPFPMERFIPRLNPGIGKAWLQFLNINHGWVLDPFGASPHLLVEIASQGINVLTTINNPILETYLYTLASPPDKSTLANILEKLSVSPTGRKKLEDQIKEMYLTTCTQCGTEVSAKEFIWDKAQNVPIKKIYYCPNCQALFEETTSAGDIEKAKSFGKIPLHRARAIEKVVNFSSPIRPYVESVINVHPPRAITAIMTTINRLDTLNLSRQEMQYLFALLSSAFDQANALWPISPANFTPKQLRTPAIFRERNLWNLIEEQTELWSLGPKNPVPITYWPRIGEQNGNICVVRGRFKDVFTDLASLQLTALISVVPRFNQAFWSLSAVWTAWLMGRKRLGTFANVFHRRKYDWEWHTNALHSVFSKAKTILPDDAPTVIFPSDTEVEMITSSIIACQKAGFHLQGVSIKDNTSTPQIILSSKQTNRPYDLTGATISQGIKYYLSQLGQPADFLHTYLAGLITAAVLRDKPSDSVTQPSNFYQRVHKEIIEELTNNPDLIIYGKELKSIALKKWGLNNYPNNVPPLDDSVEETILDYAINHSAFQTTDVDSFLCNKFTGLFTPNPSLIQACLNSYCDFQQSWKLKDGETPPNRKADIEEIIDTLHQLGEKLGFAVITDESKSTPKTIFKHKTTGESYEFLITVTAILGKYLTLAKQQNVYRYIVIPGSRANLIAFKLNNNPLFKEKILENFEFVKFRNIRRLLKEQDTLSINNFRYQLSIDAIEYVSEQLKLI